MIINKFKKIAKLTYKTVTNVGIAGFIYLTALTGNNSISSYNSPIIKNRSELELIINDERIKAGVNENYHIHVIFEDNKPNESASAAKIGKNNYLIRLPKKDSNLSTLRHELYHIADGHCDDVLEISKNSNSLKKLLKYLFVYEPQASIYQSTGLKL